MRGHLSSVTILLAVLLGCSFLSHAQILLPLPGCEAAPAVTKILNDKLDQKALDRMKFPERLALQRQVLEDLVAKYPRELEPYERLRNLLNEHAPDEVAALHYQWGKLARQHPHDPLALYLASEALLGKNTPESIRLLEAARSQAPSFPWPARQLAGIYASGKFADQDKMKENLEAFFALCPISTDGYAQYLLPSASPALQLKVTKALAVALRSRIGKQKDVKDLKWYGTLWGREFRARPPQEHDAVRAQVARDLKRMERLNPSGDAEWQALLIYGYKQSGAPKEAISAMEDRLIREYPHSNEAYEIVSSRWDSAHKEPQDQTDTTAWTKYQKDYEEAVKGWLRDYPDHKYLQRRASFDAVSDDSSLSEKDGIAAVDTYLGFARDYEGPYWTWYYFPNAARFLIAHGWQPERALDLLKVSKKQIEDSRARERDADYFTDDELKRSRDWQIQQDLDFNGLMLQAIRQTDRPTEALPLQVSIEVPPPANKKFLSAYWLNRARFEALQKHTPDALAYYQLALQTRTDTPKMRRGRVRDDLTDEARTLWKSQGGTEAAWAVWSKPFTGTPEQLPEGRWEKATKVLPAFELPDLSGKTWRLKELQGKTLVINMWATWCSPCQAELPLLQKFHEKTKDRSDVQVLTFNIDEDLGLVAPYLKDKGYTFPVLPAISMSTIDGGAVPQMWIVDSNGIWRWKQLGFDSAMKYADFEKDILGRLGNPKASQEGTPPSSTVR